MGPQLELCELCSPLLPMFTWLCAVCVPLLPSPAALQPERLERQSFNFRRVAAPVEKK